MQSLGFEYTSRMPVKPEALLAWHQSLGAFTRLTPPWEPVSLEQAPASLSNGAVAKLRLQTPIPALSLLWVAEHETLQTGLGFVDTQAKNQGPFAYWRHEHRCLPHSEQLESSLLQDSIRYNLPLEPLSRPFGKPVVQLKLERMFRYRHAVTYNDLLRHQQANLKPKTLMVCGSSGLLGQALCAFLRGGGHRVIQLLRPSSSLPVGVAKSDILFWNPHTAETPDWSQLEETLGSPIEGVINLAGVSVAQSLFWTDSFKKSLWTSRVHLTEKLVQAMATLPTAPQFLFSASGTGFYGKRQNEQMEQVQLGEPMASLTEASPAGQPPHSFLTQLAQAWEAAAYKAENKGTRVCTLRIGLVLDAKGGFLKAVGNPMKLGAGLQLGDDHAPLAWISLEDVLGSLLHLMQHESISGAVNLVAPSTVSRKQLFQTLAKVMQRPLWGAVPNKLCQSLLGQFAEEVLLASHALKPAVLEQSGFHFMLPNLEQTLRHTLGYFTPEEALLGI